jgi:hypothetical protein
MQTPGLGGGERYTVGFVEDKSRASAVYTTKDKSSQTVLNCFKDFCVRVGKPRRLRVDNGGEFVSGEFKLWCREQGILMEETMPYTPEQNGLMERNWRTLMNATRAQLREAKLDDSFWAWAMEAANYCRNRTPSRTIGNQTPLGVLRGRRPNIRNVRVFGCAAYVHVDKERRQGKLDDRAFKGIFVGYEPQTKGYRVFNPRTGRVVRSRNVTFDESQCGGDVLAELAGTKPANEGASVVPVCDDDSSSSDGDEPVENADRPATVSSLPVAEDSVVSAPVARSSRGRILRKPRDFWKAVANHAETSSDSGYEQAKSVPVPRTYEQAMKWDPVRWGDAVKQELQSQVSLGVWTVVDAASVPPGRNTVGSRWVLSVKEKPDGSVDRFKARLVAQGFSQVEGLDYTETYAPVVRMTTLRTMLAVATHHRYSVFQVDVKTAYLNSPLDEEIYMRAPPGLELAEHSSLVGSGGQVVLRLHKSIYGLKQAGRNWNTMLNEWLLKSSGLGLVRSTVDQCLYVSRGSEGYLAVLVFVDDLVIVSETDSARDKFLGLFQGKFRTDEARCIQWFLGLGVRYDCEQGELVLEQSKYVRDMLKTFGMLEAHAQYVPATSERLTKDDSVDANAADPAATKLYQSLVGSLIYAATCTRPDISFAVSAVGAFAAHPGSRHMEAAKRILRYLKGTPNDGIRYSAGSEQGLVLAGFVDADWAGDLDCRRSTTGYVFTLCGGAVAWTCRRQRTIALSSSEAEYMALGDAVQEALYLRQLLDDMGFKQSGPTLLFEDNQGCIFMANKDAHSKRTKHIDIRFKFVQEAVQEQTVSVQYLHSKMMPADCLTKPLSRDRLGVCRNMIMHCPSVEPGDT